MSTKRAVAGEVTFLSLVRKDDVNCMEAGHECSIVKIAERVASRRGKNRVRNIYGRLMNLDERFDQDRSKERVGVDENRKKYGFTNIRILSACGIMPLI